MRIRSCQLVSLLALGLVTACGADSPIPNGFYLGDNVTFQVNDIVAVSDLRIQGIECRVPFEPNPILSICKHAAPGYIWGSFSVDGGEFTASTDELVVKGRFEDDQASGTWTFSRTCFEGSLCQASGSWTAAYKYAVAPPEPDVEPSPDAVDDTLIAPGPDIQSRIEGIPAPPTSATPDQVKANTYLNTIRQQVGVASALQLEPLNMAAQSHADYYGHHAAKYDWAGLSPHQENVDWDEGFTGVSIGERCAHQGYSGGWLWEVMGFRSEPHAAIDGWIDTLYHRIPLIHPNTEAYGYGMSTQGEACDVIDGSYGAAPLPGPARWPLPNTSGVATAWMGWESPQPPLPDDQAYPSGPIVSITFPRSTPMKLTRAVLLDPSGNDVPAQVQTPENDSWLSTTWAIYAYEPLMGQSTYTVRFEGDVKGSPYTDSWSFTTR